ncbi:hypothetical protein MRB53_037312 [Persea americana]|nr:hypothetical protein MRB53_037312 [Persea americana]
MPLQLSYIASGTLILGATYLLNAKEERLAPALVLTDTEKPNARSLEPAYFDIEAARSPRSLSEKDGGLSTSRPGTPTGVRHHLRSHSGRRSD